MPQALNSNKITKYDKLHLNLLGILFTMSPLKILTHSSTKKATHSIIWMHGLGASAYDFEPILPYLELNEQTRVIFPQAQELAISINHGHKMPAWYDIFDMHFKYTDHEGIKKSSLALKNIFEKECNLGILPKNIFWIGFSQGALMALNMGLNTECAGIIALSGYYPDDLLIPSAMNQSPHILHIHGKQDPIVPYNLALKTQQRLLQNGYQAHLIGLGMEHTINFEAIEHIKKRLKAQSF